jgi:hypothetical protein
MRVLLAVALLVSLVPALHAADDDNPYKKTKVGDWVEYKMTSATIAGKTKMTITAKDDKEVTYELTGTFSFMGKETVSPPQKIKVDLTKPYDQISAANLKANNTKIEKVGEGKEKLKVGDKEFDTTWRKLKATTTMGESIIITEYKMWFSKDVPMSGLVRMDTTAPGFTSKMELVGSGSK